jgi:ABC-2 type transport system ATP-binding protein
MNVIEIQGLSRRFGKKVALQDINLTVPRGVVLGLVGENGAGKTTLIKHLLGLFKAQTGFVRVFGLDSVKDPPAVLSQIGYLSENREMPEWMRISELIRYTRAFYPDWDQDYAHELIQTFELDPKQHIKSLSRGQRAKTGLLLALAYRPDLLLFDEPSSGLDPVVRRDMLAAIVRTITEEGRTVVLSSHLLDEVERVADQIVMLHQGNIILNNPLDVIKQQHHRVVVRCDQPHVQAPALPGILSIEGGPREWIVHCQSSLEQIQQAVQEVQATVVEQSHMSLDEIFVARVRR